MVKLGWIKSLGEYGPDVVAIGLQVRPLSLVSHSTGLTLASELPDLSGDDDCLRCSSVHLFLHVSRDCRPPFTAYL